MERPMHVDGRASWGSPSRMMLAVSAAMLLEAGALYLVGTGLLTRVMKAPPPPVAIELPPKAIQEFPPPLTQFVRPSQPMVVTPIIDARTPPSDFRIAAIPSQHPVTTSPVITTMSQQVTTPSAPTAPLGIAGTHSQPPYPMLARRIGKEGAVVLDITVATNGRVQDVLIAKSSGDGGLDEAAMSWVKEHWRYQPATQNGRRIVAQSEARVVFSLKQAQ